MKAYEIFQGMSPETAASVFQYLRDEQREVYTASLSTLAGNRKLRPVFVQRKPAADQIAWLSKNISLRGSDEIAEHVVQLWLMKAHQELLVQFLDGVGIEHDGEGAAEDLPEELDAKKLKSTVTKLLKDHDPEVVRVYLHVFQLQRPEGWAALNELVAETPELQFGSEEAPAKEEPVKEEPVKEEPAAEAEEPVEEAEAEEPAEDVPAEEK
ncbi:MAG: hypothetical protein P1U87_10935 [Verrucomicrobiales bacterium]|nr:hypothetical protein [Verrucomicrobiales bacterium]